MTGPSLASGRCEPTAERACVLSLHGGEGPQAAAECTGEAWAAHLGFELPDRFVDRNGDGWWETIVRVDLRPEHACSCARFQVLYGGPSVDYTVHVGDSPTNDGFGGDSGSTDYDAEALVVGTTFTVYSADTPAPVTNEQLLTLLLPPLDGRTLEIEICDQLLRVAVTDGFGDGRPLEARLSTVHGPQGFAIGSPPTRPTPVDAERADYSIYAAFNRVIHDKAGSPSQGRYGSGAARIEIFLTP